MWIPEGASTVLTCDYQHNDNAYPIWKFNNEIIFADLMSPNELLYDNIHGEVFNSTTSSLHIREFQAVNSGNYTCIINMVRHCDYSLSMFGKCPMVDGLYNLIVMAAFTESGHSPSCVVVMNQASCTVIIEIT